jgi:hypothetical protein
MVVLGDHHLLRGDGMGRYTAAPEARGSVVRDEIKKGELVQEFSLNPKTIERFPF